MRPLFLAALAAFVIATATHTASAAARIEQLRPERASPGQACTADRKWCVRAADGSATILYRDGSAPRTITTLPLPSNEDERLDSALWPSVVRLALPGQAELALIGVVRTQSEMYSGGSGSVSTLTLFEIEPTGSSQPRAVIEAPLAGNFMIRACFTPQDQRRRHDACHDEYRYSASLTAPPQGATDARLVYRARADSFPGRRRRYADSNREGRLRKTDLRRAVDPRCTFERSLIRNPATGMFAWSAPLPDCRDFLELQ